MGTTPYVHLDASLVGATPGVELPLSTDDDHHLRRVLRLRDGDQIAVTDGAGSVATAVLAPAGVELTAGAVTTPPPRPRLTVAQALPKGRRMDEVVRQVTELGADAIVPVTAARCVARLEGDRATRAVARWRAVARAAAEQARRPWRAEVTDLTTVPDLAATTSATLLVAHPEADLGLPDAVEPAAGAIVVAVGPEGGWTDEEVVALTGQGGRTVHLGPAVLRTEHAAAAAVAVVAALSGRWA